MGTLLVSFIVAVVVASIFLAIVWWILGLLPFPVPNKQTVFYCILALVALWFFLRFAAPLIESYMR